ncbi:E3 ubiquitin-protein ligase [Vigna unguiculata]|uniref:RING-type E3 ubiquitin transferase n=1 Tax=Vigna unguiculata TaxID=3917 RepID=A0A4D6KV61_VIGUN|nr:E3 ubiquitin-protein ligase [Vigna unguiculata]
MQRKEGERKVTDASHLFVKPTTSFPYQRDGSVGEANENNKNEEGLHEEGLAETEVNLPEEGDNNNNNNDVPLHETLNAVALDSNMSASSFHVGSSSNTVNIPRKRNFGSSGHFYQGESSNMGQQQVTGEAKRLATESEGGANNNVSPHNAGTPIPPIPPPPNAGANRNENTDTGRRASYATLPGQASLYFNGASTHPAQHPLQRIGSVQPLSFQGSAFMRSATSTVNSVTVRTTPPTRCPHPRVDIIIPFYEHGSSSTRPPPQATPRINHSAAGNSSATQNNQNSALPPNFISPELRGRLPSEIENSEPSTAGLSLQTIMQHMERETLVDVDGDDPVEHQKRCTICLEEFENGSEIGKMQLCDHKFHFDCIKQWLVQKNLCPVQSILDSLSNGRGLIFEIENSEPSTAGLSLQTIMQHMERETLVDVDGDDPVEHQKRCTICLEEFENGSEIGKMQLCDHKFHFDCIKQWLVQKNLCPVQSILDSLSNGRGLIFEIENSEPSTAGLSLQTIMQHMERETLVDVDGDDPVEHQKRCTICLEEFENGSEIGKMQLCDHKFHFDCIKQWLVQKNLCPVCRRVALNRHLNGPNREYGYFFI